MATTSNATIAEVGQADRTYGADAFISDSSVGDRTLFPSPYTLHNVEGFPRNQATGINTNQSPDFPKPLTAIGARISVCFIDRGLVSLEPCRKRG